jgi:hypothetical protein
MKTCNVDLPICSYLSPYTSSPREGGASNDGISVTARAESDVHLTHSLSASPPIAREPDWPQEARVFASPTVHPSAPP